MAEAKSAKGQPIARPLSPHLQVYKPLINMIMSILHRMTGAALYFGFLLLAWWLAAAASGPQYFDFVNNTLFGSLPGKVVLFGYTWALMQHMAGGIRHFIWDTGRGYGLGTIDILCWLSILFSLVSTGLIWGYVVYVRGGL